MRWPSVRGRPACTPHLPSHTSASSTTTPRSRRTTRLGTPLPHCSPAQALSLDASDAFSAQMLQVALEAALHDGADPARDLAPHTSSPIHPLLHPDAPDLSNVSQSTAMSFV